MIRKILMFAITTGLASKLYRQYRQKQGGFGASAFGGEAPASQGFKKASSASATPGSSTAGMEV